jgi:hypothetical protein
VHLHGNYPYDAAPTESDAAKVKEGHIESIRPFANLFKDLGVVLRKTSRDRLLLLLLFAGRAAILVVDCNFLEIRVLRDEA